MRRPIKGSALSGASEKIIKKIEGEHRKSEPVVSFWTHVGKFHFLAVVDAGDNGLALRHDVVVVDVVRQKAELYKTSPITVTGIGCKIEGAEKSTIHML